MDDFLNKLKACSNPNDMPVTMVGPNDHYYIHIYFENLIFCAVLREETCPLMVTEFLHRIKDIFIDYFGVCNVDSIKERFFFYRKGSLSVGPGLGTINTNKKRTVKRKIS